MEVTEEKTPEDQIRFLRARVKSLQIMVDALYQNQGTTQLGLLRTALEVYDSHEECGLTKEWAHSVRLQLRLI